MIPVWEGPLDGRLADDESEDDVEMAVLLRALPSLAAFYGRDLTLLASAEDYAASYNGTPRALRGRTLLEVVGPDEHARCLSYFIRAAAGSTEHLELTRVDAAGRFRLQRLTLVPHVVDGLQVGIALLVEDVPVL